jgi:hypothetical protein
MLAVVCGLASPALAQLTDDQIHRIAGDPNDGGGDVGQYASLGQDAAGGQHIAYYDATFQQLKYAHRASTGAPWVIDVLATTVPLGQHCSLAVGAEQNVFAGGAVTNGSTTIRVTGGLIVSSLLIGGTFHAGASPDYTIADVDPEAGEFTLATPWVGVTDPNVAIFVDFYQPVVSFQEGTSSRRLRVARPRGDGGWIMDIVDDPAAQGGVSFTGFESSVALGNDGTIHVAYRDAATTGGVANALRYAKFNGVAWSKSSPDPNPARGFGCRIVVDQDNAPVIFHRDNIGLDMRVTFKDDATTSVWRQQAIDTAGNNGRGIGATYYGPGDIAISVYHRQDTTSVTTLVPKLTAGVDALGARQFFVFPMAQDIGIGDYTSLAHGPGVGDLHLTYYDAGERRLETALLGQAFGPNVNVTPRILDDDEEVGLFCSSGINAADGDLYAAYYDSLGRALKVAHDDGVSSPTNAFVDGLKHGVDSAIGRTSTHIVVAYYESNEGVLRLARWPIGEDPETSAGFVDFVLDSDSTDLGESVAMEIDDGDNIHLLYIDRQRHDLRAAVVYPDWTFALRPVSGLYEGVNVGEYCDLAINRIGNDPPDRLAAVFHVVSNPFIAAPHPTLYYGEAMLTTPTAPGIYPMTWSFQPAVPGSANVGRYCSVTYGLLNRIHMAYFDDTELAPAYAVIDESGNSSGGELIEGSLFENSGHETSIAINPGTGRPAVAYYDITNAGLKYAEQTETGWDVELIDADGDTGHDPVLRFNRFMGTDRILYYDRTGGRLRMAMRTLLNRQWQVFTVTDDTRGYHPSMEIDPVDGFMAMSFHQLRTGNLLTVFVDSIPIPTATDGVWLRLP